MMSSTNASVVAGLDEHAKMSIWSVGWRTGADALAARRPQVPAVARTCIVTVGNYKAEQSPVEISALAERIAQGSCYPGEEVSAHAADVFARPSTA